MEFPVRPALPILVDNDAHLTRPSPTYKSGNVVQTTGATSFGKQKRLSPFGHRGCPGHHDPVLGALKMFLHAKRGTGLDHEALNLEALPSVNAFCAHRSKSCRLRSHILWVITAASHGVPTAFQDVGRKLLECGN